LKTHKFSRSVALSDTSESLTYDREAILIYFDRPV